MIGWAAAARWGLPVLAFAGWTAGAYWLGLDHGADNCAKEQAQAVETIREEDAEDWRRDVGKQQAASARGGRRAQAVQGVVDEFVEEGRSDPERQRCVVDDDRRERLRRAFQEIDAAAREAAAPAGAGGSE